MPDPFEEDLTGNAADAADDRDIQKLKQAAGGGDPPPDSDEGDGLGPRQPTMTDDLRDFVVDLDGDEDDDDKPGPSHKEKKRNRFREAIERADAAEDRARKVQQRLEEVERRLMAQPPTVAGPPQEDPYEKQLQGIRGEQKQLRLLYSSRFADKTNPMTQEEADQYDRQFAGLEDKATDIRFDKRMKERESGQQGNNLNQMLQVKYMDLAYHPQAKNSALGLYIQRVAEGAQPGPALLEDIADETYKKFKIGPYRKGVAPSQGAKRKLSGHPSGGIDKSGSRAGKSRKIMMTKDLRRMADAMYPHLPPKERYETWAKTIGSKSLDEIESKRT